jgi:hypothetical protein
MDGRKKYGRPQAMLFANNPGIVDGGKIVPEGEEFTDFIILSDDNRDPISFSVDRIETRKRMINGRQRSYHVADKIKISTGWKGLPSRAFGSDPSFTNLGASQLNETTGVRRPDEQGGYSTIGKEFFTSDNGAGGAELLKWYDNNPGSFWVYLAYDNHKNFSTDEFNKLNQYNEVVEVFFSNFSYSVEKRGASTHDYWNIDIDLEEV